MDEDGIATGMRFTRPLSFDDVTEREWLLTNELGGYASASLCGMLTRRYHGLLVAALRPPGQRTVLVAKLEETLTVNDKHFELGTNQYPGTIHPHGYTYLEEFDARDAAVVMRFAAGGATLDKEIAMVTGENTTRVRYRNTGTEPIELTIRPLVNARDFHGETAAQSIGFGIEPGRWPHGPQVHIRPHWMPDGFWLYADEGSWRTDENWFYNLVYCWECRRGLTDIDNHFSPGYFRLALAPGAEVVVVLSTAPPPAAMTEPSIDTLSSPLAEYPIPADDPPAVRRLFQTAHSFLVRRGSVHNEALDAGRTVIAGYHWFGDWGRDTMIALPGLCLTTGRHRDAAEILRTFAAARRRGLLPNLFMETGGGEAYNTVDASLWFVDAVERYFRATQDTVLVEELRPALEEVIHYYRYGTDFDIMMDRDALIKADAPGWQLTWMDAKVGDWVVTPRMGKPVEINALWYNALRIMENFATRFGWQGDYGDLAERVRKSFSAYWHAQGGYLYDLLAERPDARIRPNQIFAVSLPYSPLDLNQARAVVETVERHLLTPYGLRTLAPSDPEYHGHYGGDTRARDGAYHQGTVWAWLMGPYVDAYLRVNGHTERAKSLCRTLLKPLLAHVWDAGCVGSINEIFEGNAPHMPRGTISQAWSVSEVLRAWEKCRPAPTVVEKGDSCERG